MSALAGVSRRGRNMRGTTKQGLLGKEAEIEPVEEADEAGETLHQIMARREAEKKIGELAVNEEGDAQSYFAALKRMNDEKPLLQKMMPSSSGQGGKGPPGEELPPVSVEYGRGKASGEALSAAAKRPRKPWRSMSKLERTFQVLCTFFYVANLVAIVVFAYLAFGLFRTDKEVDPMAWRLSYGITAVLIVFQTLQMYFDYIRLFPLWMVLVCIMEVGLLYGAIRHFLYVYQSDFPCFRGFKLGNEEYSMCMKGRLLISLSLAVFYLTVLAFFTWRWKIFRKREKQRTGEMEADIDLTDILSGVDDLHREAKRAQAGVVATKEPPRQYLANSSQDGEAQSLLPGVSARAYSTIDPSRRGAASYSAAQASQLFPPPSRGGINPAAQKLALPYEAPTPPVKNMRLRPDPN